MKDYRIYELLESDNSYKDRINGIAALIPVIINPNSILRQQREAYEIGVEFGFQMGAEWAQKDLVNLWHPTLSDPKLIEFRDRLLALHKEYAISLQYHTGQGLGHVINNQRHADKP